MFGFIWKKYPKQFAFLILSILESFVRKVWNFEKKVTFYLILSRVLISPKVNGYIMRTLRHIISCEDEDIDRFSTVFHHLCHYTYIYMKDKLNIFGASVSKWSLISKSNFDFEIELRFQNRTSIFERSFHLKIELPFRNGASILKWSFHFEMELRFQNRANGLLAIRSTF